MHVGIANPRWWGKRSRHSRCMRNRQFCVSGKRPMAHSHSTYLLIIIVSILWAFLKVSPVTKDNVFVRFPYCSAPATDLISSCDNFSTPQQLPYLSRYLVALMASPTHHLIRFWGFWSWHWPSIFKVKYLIYYISGKMIWYAWNPKQTHRMKDSTPIWPWPAPSVFKVIFWICNISGKWSDWYEMANGHIAFDLGCDPDFARPSLVWAGYNQLQ